MAILIDANILVAYLHPRDAHHAEARRFLRNLVGEARLVVSPVLSEVFHLMLERTYYQLAVDGLKFSASAFQIVQVESQDLARAIAIMEQYEDTEFDYTDAAIMAVSERMNISRIATFDRRDFEIFRPTHVPNYELLPTL